MERVEALSVLAVLAEDQSGLVTAAQASARGVDRVTQKRLAEDDLLERVGRGVYRVAGAAPPQYPEIRVAWLRLDPGRPAWERDGLGANDGVVSHRSACLVHRLGDIPAPAVEITVPRRRTTRELDVRLLIREGMTPEDVVMIEGLPVTTAARTVVDLLADHADGGHVGGVIADAEQRGLIAIDDLAPRVQHLAASYGMPGASGHELLAELANQAGRALRADELRDAALAGMTLGYEQAVRSLAMDPAVWRALDKLIKDRSPLRADVIQMDVVLRANVEVDGSLHQRTRNIMASPTAVRGEARKKKALPTAANPDSES